MNIAWKSGKNKNASHIIGAWSLELTNTGCVCQHLGYGLKLETLGKLLNFGHHWAHLIQTCLLASQIPSWCKISQPSTAPGRVCFCLRDHCVRPCGCTPDFLAWNVGWGSAVLWGSIMSQDIESTLSQSGWWFQAIPRNMLKSTRHHGLNPDGHL